MWRTPRGPSLRGLPHSCFGGLPGAPVLPGLGAGQAGKRAQPPRPPHPHPRGGRFLLRGGPAAQLHRKHRRGPGRRRVASGGHHVRLHCPRATHPSTWYIGYRRCTKPPSPLRACMYRFTSRSPIQVTPGAPRRHENAVQLLFTRLRAIN
jgi:hypothetical protein